jgi:hypothetical protein
MYEAGDPFKLRATFSGSAGLNVDLYVLLELDGLHWFWPSWRQTPDMERYRFWIHD